jgi:hypothetical protein
VQRRAIKREDVVRKVSRPCSQKKLLRFVGEVVYHIDSLTRPCSGVVGTDIPLDAFDLRRAVVGIMQVKHAAACALFQPFAEEP